MKKSGIGEYTVADGTFDYLSAWEWTTLVGAWRYYEFRNTIASASFPAQIVERYWQGKMFTNCARTHIANQFAKVDHGANGEADWKSQPECDRIKWAKFHAFCNAWCDGFLKAKVFTAHGNLREVVCFKSETTGRLYPASKYVSKPTLECYLDEKNVKTITKIKDVLRSRKEAMKGVRR